MLENLFLSVDTETLLTIIIVELWVISVLEIGHAFPLIAVDINELTYLCGSKRTVYRPFTASVDGESQSSKEVTNYIP